MGARPGRALAPDDPASGLLSAGPSLGSAPAQSTAGAPTTGGLGVAVLGASLELWIPVTAKSGAYGGVLTITVV